MRIGHLDVGISHRPKISCELGISHGGSLEVAKQMIDAALEAGVDAIKVQHCRPEHLDAATFTTEYTYQQFDHNEYIAKHRCPRDDEEYDINPLFKQVTETIGDIYARCGLSDADIAEIKRYCDERGTVFHATPTSAEGVHFLADIGTAAFKVASDMVGKRSIWQAINEHPDIPVICSLGLVLDDEWWNWVAAKNCLPLHAVTQYPATSARLWRITQWYHSQAGRKIIRPIGYSDHCEGVTAAIRAAEFGAVWLEVHFTLDKMTPGPDHHWSKDPTELKAICEAVK